MGNQSSWSAQLHELNCQRNRANHLFQVLCGRGEIRTPKRDYSQWILSPFEAILPDLTNRDEPIRTGLAAVKVMLRPVRSHDMMSSS